MKWIAPILLIALWAAVSVILLTPEVPGGHGFQHSRFAAMDQGGDGVGRHESHFVAGWAFGSLLIAVFVSLLFWGTSRRGFLRVFLAGGLIYEGIFGVMCFYYWKSLSDPEIEFVGPFPASVSLLLFGIWLIPLYFIGVYVFFYHRWIFPGTSAQKFAELVRQRSQS